MQEWMEDKKEEAAFGLPNFIRSILPTHHKFRYNKAQEVGGAINFK